MNSTENMAILHHLAKVLPNCWTGEANCLVGPFSSKRVAEYFAVQIVNSYMSGPKAGAIVTLQDAWFLQITTATSV